MKLIIQNFITEKGKFIISDKKISVKLLLLLPEITQIIIPVTKINSV
jgi:hypothetical protein